MPAISRLICSRCGFETEIMDHLVFFDGRDFVPLTHPIEGSDLRERGYSAKRALCEGRLLVLEYCVCHDCMSVVACRSFKCSAWVSWATSISQRDYFKPLAWTIAAAAAVPVIAFNLSGWLYPLLFILLFLVVDVVAGIVERRSVLRTARKSLAAAARMGDILEVNACSHCGGKRLTSYLTYLVAERDEQKPGPRFRCPKCTEHTLEDDPTCRMIA